MENIIDSISDMKFAQSVKTFVKTFMTPYNNHKEVFQRTLFSFSENFIQLLKGIMITRWLNIPLGKTRASYFNLLFRIGLVIFKVTEAYGRKSFIVVSEISI